MAKRGRKPIQIDQVNFEKLCGLMCTIDEISGFFKCCSDTLEAWCKRTYGVNFSEAFKRFSANGKMSLRRYQFKLAEKNASMAIFLGKNYLGQKDNPDTSDIDRVQDAILELAHSIETVSAEDATH